MNQGVPFSIWIGWDPREHAAFEVCRAAVRKQLRFSQFPVRGVVLEDLKRAGLYRRPTERRLGRLHDLLSRTADYDGAMSTEFAIARFLVPELVRRAWKPPHGWALFMDCDMLPRAPMDELLRAVEYRSEAVLCVKHRHEPQTRVKMDDQAQLSYARKNWSSFMFFNVDHPANAALTVELVNTLPGRDLHRFCWLNDEEIGELPVEWNWLNGVSDPAVEPKNVHFTEGGPWFEAFRAVPYADEWLETLYALAR